MGFIRNMAGHEHVGFIYCGKAIKDAVLSQFFDPSVPPEPLKALISLGINANPVEIDNTQRMTYDEFLKAESKSKAMDDMFAWIGEMHKSNRSGRETRIAGEDASRFLRNGFESEFLDAEKKIGRRLQERMSVLCSYYPEGITLECQPQRTIESHVRNN